MENTNDWIIALYNYLDSTLPLGGADEAFRVAPEAIRAEIAAATARQSDNTRISVSHPQETGRAEIETTDTRADFEAHFGLTTRQKWQHKDGSYQFPEIQAKWEGYLAGMAKAAPVAAMTDDDIIKLAQQFNVRKTWAEVAEETVSYKFDAMGFARALLAKAAPLAAAAPAKRHAPLLDELLAAAERDGVTRLPIPAWDDEPVAAAAPGADRMPHGWLYGNSFWHRDNPRITEDVMKNGKPLYE